MIRSMIALAVTALALVTVPAGGRAEGAGPPRGAAQAGVAAGDGWHLHQAAGFRLHLRHHFVRPHGDHRAHRSRHYRGHRYGHHRGHGYHRYRGHRYGHHRGHGNHRYRSHRYRPYRGHRGHGHHGYELHHRR